MKKIFFLCFFLQISLYSEVVVCIHGFMRTEKCMAMMKSSFQNAGCTVYNWGYPSKDKLIEEHAQDLNIFLNEVLLFHPDEEIHFVTHSLGGIILRAAAQQKGFPLQAKRGKAVLIAPPNKGSCFGNYLAKFAWVRKLVGSKSGSQLLNTRSFLDLGPFPSTMKILVISGTLGFNPIIKDRNDGKVGVQESCLAQTHLHRTVKASHSWICYSPQTIALAKKFLLDY